MPHTTRNAAPHSNAMQCNHSAGVVLASCLVSSQGCAARGEPNCQTVHRAGCSSLPHASQVQTRRPLRSRLPGMMLHAHVAFRFRCVLNLPCPGPRFPCPVLPAYRRARECCLAGWAGHVSSNSSSILTTPPALQSCLPSRPSRSSSHRQVNTLRPVLSLEPWPQSLFES